MFGLSAFQIAEVLVICIAAGAGAILIMNGLRRLNSPSATPLPPPVTTGIQRQNFGTAPEPGQTSEGFFGGTITPATSPGFQANPPSNMLTTAKTPGGPLPLILLVLGLVLMGGSAYAGYNVWTNRSGIHMPDQLLGMDRVDDDSAMGQALDNLDSEFQGSGIDQVQVAAYGDTTQFAMVVAGKISTDALGNQFLADFETRPDVSGGDFTLEKVDAGPMGGSMRCGFATANSSVSFCMWVDDVGHAGGRVLGIVVLGGSISANSVQAAITVRGAITG